MIMIREHKVQWVTAAPLWNDASSAPVVMQRPALLRFETDTFMEDLTSLLAKSPQRLDEFVAVPKSYRQRPIGEEMNWKPTTENGALKLFQPAHGQFNLVTATLVCRLPGMPDRALEPARDQVGFCLRRLDVDGAEMAWSSREGRKVWQRIAPVEIDRTSLGEEVLPLFAVPFFENNHRRRLFVGLIPTSSRETFQSAPTLAPDLRLSRARPA